MTSISTLSSSSTSWSQAAAWAAQSRAAQVDPTAVNAGSTPITEQLTGVRELPPTPPPTNPAGVGGNPRGQLAGLADPEKLNQLSDLLTMPEDDVTTSATSATKLVELLQNKGVDLGQLRNVLNSGDLLDVRA